MKSCTACTPEPLAALSKQDEQGLRLAFRQALRAREHGNHPFGAVLQDANGEPILAAENSVVSQHDVTGHAELNLVRLASRDIAAARLQNSTLYCSSEPCPMCAGAIVWANVRRVVYGLGMEDIYALAKIPPGLPALHLGSRAVFASAPYSMEIIGPALEQEARAPHLGFW